MIVLKPTHGPDDPVAYIVTATSLEEVAAVREWCASSLPPDSYRKVHFASFNGRSRRISHHKLSFTVEANAALFLTFWMPGSDQA